MSRLEELRVFVESEFPENWYDEYTFSTDDEEQVDQFLANVAQKIETFKEKAFELLNFSLIEGEHISLHKLSDELHKTIESISSIALPSIFDFFNSKNRDVQDVIEYLIYSNCVKILTRSLTLYELVSSQIARNLEYSDKKHLFEEIDEYRSVFTSEETLSKTSQDISTAFVINLYSLRRDHMLLLSSDSLRELVLYSRQLLNQNFTYKNAPCVKIILNRIYFLIRKIIYRYQEKGTPLITVVDSRETELSVEQFPIDIFTYWDKKCQTHYEKHSNHVARLKSEYESASTTGPTELSFVQYHVKTKYFKDIRKQVTDLEKTYNDFELVSRTDSISNNLLDISAAKTSANYLQNNVLSLKVEADKENREGIVAAFKVATELQNNTGVKNYFPYNKYLFWLSENIEKQFEGEGNSTDLSSLQRDIADYKNILNRFDSALEWSEDHYFLAYQLPFKECVTEELINEQTYNVFLASSFVLPVDYNKVREDLEKHRNNLVRYELLLQFNKDIQPERRQLELIQQEVKGTERRTIEILGIFAALVIFAAGAINTLRFNYTPRVAFLFMFALGSSLSTFVAVIITVARGASHLKRNWPIYTTLAIVGILCWYFLGAFSKDDQEEAQDQVQQQANSPAVEDSVRQIPKSGNSPKIRLTPDSTER